MNLGPYTAADQRIAYKGNRFFPSQDDVRNIVPPLLAQRHLELSREPGRWGALMRIWNAVFCISNEFMAQQGALLFDLPITTRMISSPGALTGTIPSDVDPFEICFFDSQTYLTQSSQLYLEFAITHPDVPRVYSWEKSFRREPSDFRHLPEFTHIEFEGVMDLGQVMRFQEDYLRFLLARLVADHRPDLSVFLNPEDVDALGAISALPAFEHMTFTQAFARLFSLTHDKRYEQPAIANFGAYEEILLTQDMAKPLFITHYIQDEVAFYHAPDEQDPRLAKNADLLFPGYGELIGCGERVHTREETINKALHFKLNMDDYQPYIDSRDPERPLIHSGWGMGIERFIQAVLKLPFIWDAKPFPRVHNQNRP